MKYLCLQTCQTRIQGHITMVHQGSVRQFEEDPGSRFKCLEEAHTVDFLTAKADELKEAKWTFENARLAIYEKYGVELKRETNTKRSEIIDQILDARFRAVNKEDVAKRAAVA